MPDMVMVTRAKLDSLAEAVGSKSGQGVPLTIEGMEDAVLGIETGIQPSGTLSISKNGTHDVTKYASARVSVPTPEPNLQNKTVRPTTVVQYVDPDSGYDGLGEVVVERMRLVTATVTPSAETQVAAPEKEYIVSLPEVTPNSSVYTYYNVISESSFIDAGYEYRITGTVGYHNGEFNYIAEFDTSFDTYSGVASASAVSSDGMLRIILNYTYVTLRCNNAEIGSYMTRVDASTLTITKCYDGLSQVTVNPIPSEYVVPNMQEKKSSVSIGGSTLEVVADPGYTGLSRVTVDAVPYLEEPNDYGVGVSIG